MKQMTLALALFCQTLIAAEFSTQPDKGQVLFKATGLGLRFEGKGVGASGKLATGKAVTGKFEFELDTLDTGIGMRNSHMKEKYLETGKHPKSELVITRVEAFDESAAEQETGFEGLLTVRGVQKPVQNGRVRIVKAGAGYKVDAAFDIKISAFEIPLPKYAGVVVRDDLRVEAKLELTPKAM